MLDSLAGLKAIMPDLTGAQRRAAKIILQRPEDIAWKSMRQLAGAAGVSPPTMLRLAERLGHGNWEEFRNVCRRDGLGFSFVSRARAFHHKMDGVSQPPSTETLAAAFQGLEALAETLDQEMLERAAEKMVNADLVVIFGMRSSRAVARVLHTATQLFRSRVVLADIAGEIFVDSLADLSRNSAVICVGSRPYSTNSVRALDFARSAGATTICLTDDYGSPLAKRADVALVAPTGGVSVVPSIVPMTVLAEMLANTALRLAGEEGLKMVEERERALFANNAYWSDGKGLHELPRQHASQAGETGGTKR
jgi:DNA-binding MurR/RpiR family transcriptional regulator